jgi:hypothetical protein
MNHEAKPVKWEYRLVLPIQSLIKIQRLEITSGSKPNGIFGSLLKVQSLRCSLPYAVNRSVQTVAMTRICTKMAAMVYHDKIFPFTRNVKYSKNNEQKK